MIDLYVLAVIQRPKGDYILLTKVDGHLLDVEIMDKDKVSLKDIFWCLRHLMLVEHK